jgi:uncharacterized membrane protein
MNIEINNSVIYIFAPMKSFYSCLSLIADVATKILEGLSLYLTYSVYKVCICSRG